MDKKARHEEFVTGFAGGPILETYLVSGVIVISMIAQSQISQLLQDQPSKLMCDFVFNWLVVLAAVTFYANKLYLLSFILFITWLLAFVAKKQQTNTNTNANTNKKSHGKQSKPKPAAKKQASAAISPVAYRPFLTNYRSAMMVLTMAAILAVDFTAFPRRFAKTETWGTSLMDLGVGSFVFSLGIVSARKELKSVGSDLPFVKEIIISINQTLKVFALGIVRLITVKGLDYQEHVSEYGVHWNFFFTLSLLPISFVFVRRLSLPKISLSYASKGIIIGLAHEILLKNTGLQEWTLVGPRVSLISQNKEGIVSFVGYLSIFTFGYALGLHILKSTTTFKQIVTKSALWAGAAQASLMLLRVATEPSRRLANLPYICWVVAFNAGFIAVLAIVEKCFDMPPSPSYAAVNKFGETMFVMSNIATGVVNILFDTVIMGHVGTIVILSAYMAVLMALSLIQVRFRS